MPGNVYPSPAATLHFAYYTVIKGNQASLRTAQRIGWKYNSGAINTDVTTMQTMVPCLETSCVIQRSSEIRVAEELRATVSELQTSQFILQHWCDKPNGLNWNFWTCYKLGSGTVTRPHQNGWGTPIPISLSAAKWSVIIRRPVTSSSDAESDNEEGIRCYCTS